MAKQRKYGITEAEQAALKEAYTSIANSHAYFTGDTWRVKATGRVPSWNNLIAKVFGKGYDSTPVFRYARHFVDRNIFHYPAVIDVQNVRLTRLPDHQFLVNYWRTDGRLGMPQEIDGFAKFMLIDVLRKKFPDHTIWTGIELQPPVWERPEADRFFDAK